MLQQNNDSSIDITFFAACRRNNLQQLKYCLHSNVNVNAIDNHGVSGIHYVVQRGYYEHLDALLEHPRIDVNSTSAKGYTALMWACRFGEEGMVNLLISHGGVDLNARDHVGWTAARHAVAKGRIQKK